MYACNYTLMWDKLIKFISVRFGLSDDWWIGVGWRRLVLSKTLLNIPILSYLWVPPLSSIFIHLWDPILSIILKYQFGSSCSISNTRNLWNLSRFFRSRKGNAQWSYHAIKKRRRETLFLRIIVLHWSTQ